VIALVHDGPLAYQGRVWVKLRKARYEHFEAAFPHNRTRPFVIGSSGLGQKATRSLLLEGRQELGRWL
jgi:hypothetical protein